MLETLSWIDTSEARFLFVSRTLIFGFATVAVLSAFWPRLDARFTDRRATLGYLAAALLVLVGTRWPTFFIRGPLNQDEAQMLAQAITALHNPIPWLSFDGTTSGPFNTYVLTLPALVFLHPSFFTTRVIGLLLEFGAIVSLYVAAALRFDRTIARIAIVPPVLLFAGLTDPELVHYSSERLSIFLGTLSLALLCLALRHRLGAGWLFGIGLATGTMPLAKLQATPLAAALAALSLVVVLTSPALGVRSKVARAAALAAGVITVPAVTLGIVALAGAFNDFWISYIQMAIAYILWQYPPLSYLLATPQIGPPIDVLLLATAAGAGVLAFSWKGIAPAQRNAFLATLFILAAAIYTIYSPKRTTVHYLLFSVLPAACAAGAALGLLGARFAPGTTAGRVRGTFAAVLVAASLLATSAFVRPANVYLWTVQNYLNDPPDPLSALMSQYLRPGDRLAIWGWRPQYYVDTDTLLGTRDSITQYHVSHDFNPYLDYFRARYVSDLRKNKPRGFLDVGNESFDFGKTGGFGYEMFPQLAEVVRRDYVLVGTVNGKRFFVRRDAPGR